MSMLFEHHGVKALEAHKERPPVKTKEQHLGINGRIALFVTESVGTMWMAYAFAALAFVALPGIHTVLEAVQWISQTFIQLVMLSVIMVGQNIQGAAADKRSEQTYEDAESILKENIETQKHLEAQDQAILNIQDHLLSQENVIARIEAQIQSAALQLSGILDAVRQAPSSS